MTYFRLDDHVDEHPKIAGLSDAAFRQFVTAIAYSSRNLTDGLVPRGVTWVRKAATDELIAMGLWEPMERGWQVHDYLDHQRSAATVQEQRAKARERWENFARTSREVPTKRVRSSDAATPEVPTKHARSSDAATPEVQAPLRAPRLVSEVRVRGSSYEDEASTAREAADEPDPEVIAAIRGIEAFGVEISQFVAQDVAYRIRDGTPGAWIARACQVAGKNGTRSWNYIAKVLDGWGAEGPPAPERSNGNGRSNGPRRPAGKRDEYSLPTGGDGLASPEEYAAHLAKLGISE
jgi:hypothetical protein